MGPFLDFDEFKAATVMPTADVDMLEQVLRPGYIAKRLLYWSARIMARLRKRYPNGFQAPYPETLRNWLVAIVTVEAYEARGWNPSDAQSQDLIRESDAAKAEVAEAADGKDGLIDLPTSATNEATAITAPTPLAYTETDPYTWMDRQRDDYDQGGCRGR